ncbi:MAG: SIR2 family protein [Candidatus Melainabacteria bacterium]|nr:MAG: SIR2 family protein [Candidatus Melainabacteria bacterium]
MRAKNAKTIFLLGAGASKDSNIPLSSEMGREMVNFESSEDLLDAYQDRQRRALRFIAGGLAFKAGMENYDPFYGVDVEALFNAADHLARRTSLEVSPFISAWHPAIKELECPADYQAGEKIRQLARHIFEPESVGYSKDFSNLLLGLPVDAGEFSGGSIPGFHSSFYTAFASAVKTITGQTSSVLFEELKFTMIGLLQEIVWIDPRASDSFSRVDYIKPLISFCKNNEASIATLNYDNTLELASEALSIEIDSGIKEWSKNGELSYSESSINLFKLHGSVDWRLVEETPTAKNPIPFQRIKIGNPSNDENSLPAVIFGQANKLTTEGPFLSILIKFKEALHAAEELVVVGYSFRDKHINQILSEWLNGNENRLMRIVNGKWHLYNLPFYTSEYGHLLRSRIKIEKLQANEFYAQLENR